MINKLIKDKKGFVFTIPIIVGIILVVLIIGGGLIKFNIGQIPAPIWIILGAILLFKLIGGKKKK